jgi:hypothetical protein
MFEGQFIFGKPYPAIVSFVVALISVMFVDTATKRLRSEQTVPLDEIAQKLWLRMIQDNLLDGESGSRFIFSN